MTTTNNRRLIRSGFWMRAHSMSNPRRLKSENIASTVESLLELKKRSGIGSGRSGDIPRVLFSNRPPASKVKRPTSFASDVDLLEISPLSRLKLKISQFQPAAIGTYPGVAFESKSEMPTFVSCRSSSGRWSGIPGHRAERLCNCYQSAAQPLSIGPPAAGDWCSPCCPVPAKSVGRFYRGRRVR